VIFIVRFDVYRMLPQYIRCFLIVNGQFLAGPEMLQARDE